MYWALKATAIPIIYDAVESPYSPFVIADVFSIGKGFATDGLSGGLLALATFPFPSKVSGGKINDGSSSLAQGGEVTEGGPKLLTHTSKTMFFKGDEAVQHFEKHGSELMGAFGRKSYNLKDYLNDANHVIKNGTFVPEMNGYVRLIGGKGTAKY